LQATRTTWPSMRCTNPAFEYRDSLRTNIADTFAKARERIAAEQAAQAKKPRRRTQHGPALMTIKRVRAGTTNHLTMPLF